MKKYKTLIGNTDIDITEEEQEYLDRYFPKGDKRRGDALVIFAHMKIKQINLIEKIKEILSGNTCICGHNENAHHPLVKRCIFAGCDYDHYTLKNMKGGKR